MARLENGTYQEIGAHLERELEFNALESDDLPMATMASASTYNSNLLSNGINTNKDAQCSYCKATGHYYKICPKLRKKKALGDKNGKKPQRPIYPECPTCGKKNHPVERCWEGAGAHLRPKRTHTADTAYDNCGEEKTPKKSSTTETNASGQTRSRKPDSKDYFCHDSKYMTICRFDNTSYQILRWLLSANISKTPMALRPLSGSNRWKKPTSKHTKKTIMIAQTDTMILTTLRTLRFDFAPQN